MSGWQWCRGLLVGSPLNQGAISSAVHQVHEDEDDKQIDLEENGNWRDHAWDMVQQKVMI